MHLAGKSYKKGLNAKVISYYSNQEHCLYERSCLVLYRLVCAPNIYSGSFWAVQYGTH